jgi:hypothetical protein
LDHSIISLGFCPEQLRGCVPLVGASVNGFVVSVFMMLLFYGLFWF